MSSNTLKSLLVTFGAVAALTACGGGADRVASPGEGAFPPPPTQAPPPPPPTAPPPPTGGPAADCPAGFANVGTIANNTLRACQLPALITGSLTVPKRDGTVYAISGRVDVGQDRGGDANNPASGAQQGILTIEPGVRLYGSAGLDYLVVNRGSQIFAEGTATEPVIMTSRQSIEGQTNQDSMGQWGGLVVLGRAPINACPGTTVSGTPECQAQVEGTNAFYGGNSVGDNSGRMRYLRVMHSGFEILPNNELNGITLAGVGNGTVFEYVQVHNSSDDGIEWFGGTVNGRYLVLTGNDDDSLDADTGWNGTVQFGIVLQRPGGGDRMAEFSSINRTPASNPKFANFTMVGRASSSVAIIMNQGMNAQWYNLVVTRPAEGNTGDGLGCLDVDDATTTGQFHSVFFACPQPFVDDANGQAAALFNAGTNNVPNGTSSLTDIFVNGPNENAVPAFQGLPTVSSYFQQVDYIGGVRDASDTWWQGWTCGLTAATPCH
ncbi:hypothetical protein [Coralloluteibacterium thermophilus]|uniref:Secreted protein n=1 Tax=Coralloluteibacterium thermophilum TaxID=2707049 RepID=A0ABV9NMS6_9GAMM